MLRIPLALALLLLLAAAAPARAADFAPLDRPGPALRIAESDLRSSLRCSDDVRGAGRAPVLLLPATGVNSEQNFAANYVKAFRAAKVPFCTSDQPGALSTNLDDLQTRAEYVTYAIRRVRELSGRRIAILGHSQGGMIARWSLRFWPDTRAMVEDVIGMAPSNHGTDGAIPICAAPGGCTPAIWQQRTGSAYNGALNSRTETFAGIDYTAIYTRLDQVVFPNQDAATGSSSLRGGGGRVTNVAIQDVCPTATSEHLAIGTSDPVAAALVDDALGREGPADPARVDRGVCARLLQPGSDPATFAPDTAGSFGALGTQVATYPRSAQEPALRCYVTASCPQAAGVPAPRACASRRRFAVRVDRGGARRALRVTLDGKSLRVRRRGGRRVVTVDLRGLPVRTAVLRIRGRTRGGQVRTTTRRYRTCVPRRG